MKVTTIGLDAAKHIFPVPGADAEGRAVLRRRLQRNQVAAFFANLPPCLVGLEACCGAVGVLLYRIFFVPPSQVPTAFASPASLSFSTISSE